MIYTSYFAKLKKLPDSIVPISICGKAPDWHHGIQYKKLAPKYEFFVEWKKTHDDHFYIRCFNERVLSPLNPMVIVNELFKLSNGKDIALICYEKPNDFCHRHLVADWLVKAGFTVEEWGK